MTHTPENPIMRLIIAAALALACTPALAEECLTVEQVAKNTEAAGGKIVGAASYNGSLTTEMLIVETPDLILMMGFDAKGCYFGQMAVEVAKKPDTGA